MFTTLAAVLVALALGHVAPAAAASLRRFDGFRRWLGWLDARGGKAWQGPAGVALALLPPLLLMALLAWLLRGVLFGLPSLLLGVAVLAWCWGPRDLDRDIEAIIDADDAATRQAAVRNLQSAGGSLREDIPSLVEATVLNALRRWFAVLFWFLLLGPAGALGYRLLALVGNFDTAWKAWRQAHGERLAGNIGFLGAVARASVNAELREDAHDYTEAGLLPVWQRLPDLRDAMSLVWRMLLLWLAILALLVIAGWVT